MTEAYNGVDALLRDVFTADQLHTQVFPDLVQFVHGVVTEGFGLVAGPPKLGKSWWTLNLALAVAAGGKVFGKIPVDQRPVLLLALEDSPRRLQGRIRAVLGSDLPPADLHILTKVGPKLLLVTMTAWLQQHRRGLIILDTVGKARGQRRRGDDAYQADYNDGVQLKNVVDAFPGSGLLGVHHTRKATSEDFTESLSGTNGFTGAADYILVLRRKRGSTEAELHVTGRDIAEGEYAFTVGDGGTWTLSGTELADAAAEAASRRAKTKLKQRALDVIAVVERRAPECHTTAADVAEALDITSEIARTYLNRQAEAGRILRVATGAFTSVSGVTSVMDRPTSVNTTQNTKFKTGEPSNNTLFSAPVMDAGSPMTSGNPVDVTAITERAPKGVESRRSGGATTTPGRTDTRCDCGVELVNAESRAAGRCAECRLSGGAG